MKKVTILCGMLCGVHLLISSCFAAQPQKEAKMDISNKEKAVALLRSIQTGDPEPVGYVNPNKYIQHNLMGVTVLKALVQY